MPPQMRIGKDQANRVWKRLKRQGKLLPFPEMLTVLKRQKESEAWQREEGRFIPLAERYLSKGRFQDESAPAREPPGLCGKCGGSGFRRARPGEEGIDGLLCCECKSDPEARGP